MGRGVPAGGGDASPAFDDVAGESLFLKGGYVRQHGAARRAGQSQTLECARFEMRHRCGETVHHHRHLPANGVGNRWRAAAIGGVRQLNARLFGKPQHHQVRDGYSVEPTEEALITETSRV